MNSVTTTHTPGDNDDAYVTAIASAKDTIQTILGKYSGAARSRVALAFSGGKDSIVLLHLVKEALTAATRPEDRTRPTLVYFDVSPHVAFEDTREAVELRAHISATLRNTDYTTFFDTAIVNHSTSLRDSVAAFVGEPASRFDVIFMGTRSTDPAATTIREPIAITSSGWPRFLRAMPLLSWTNSDIWRYIDTHGLPYPSLYTRGFTSIGDTHSDRPHPALYIEDKGIYKHARELLPTQDERAGRRQASQ